MTWLNPTYLWIAILAVVPVLLHFLMRQRVQRVVFAATRFLRSQKPTSLTQRRWLEWLLTFLRVGLVVAAVIAFARPLLRKDAEAATPGGREVLMVILDTSRSMSFKDRFAEAQNQAQSLINKAAPDVAIRVALFAETDHVVIQPARDKTEALALIRGAKPTAGGTDLLGALDRVFASLGDVKAGGNIHLFSDMQATGVARNREAPRTPKRFTFHAHPIGGSTDGDAVVVSGAGSALVEVLPGQNNVNVSVRASNHGPAREVTAQLMLSEKLLGERKTVLPQNGEAIISLTGTVREPGKYGAQVVLKNSPVMLQGDDHYNFVVQVVDRIRIAIVDGRPNTREVDDAAFYLTAALNAGPDSPYHAEASPILPNLDKVDVLILADVSKLTKDEVTRLEVFLREGGGLIIGLGTDIEATTFNDTFSKLLPAKLLSWLPATRETGGRFLVTADAKHTLATQLAGTGADVSAARFNGAFEIKDSQDARVVFRYDDHRPALLEKSFGKGDVLLFTSGLDTHSGDLPLRGIYVPLLRESVRFLSSRGQKLDAPALGHTLPLATGDELTMPDSSKITPTPANSGMVVIGQPGIYHWTGKEKNEFFAVNVDNAESDLTPVPAPDIEKMVDPGQDGEIRKTATGFERVLIPAEKLSAERRLNLGWWCLIAVLASFVAELYVAGRVSQK